MFKRLFKRHLRNNILFHRVLVSLITLYLKFVYITSKWEITYAANFTHKKIDRLDGALFALWHNRLAFGMYIFKDFSKIYALASSHTDGKVITDVIKAMNYGVVEGSSNRNPTGAVRSIIKLITEDKSKVVITPDGPRGPLYKINSNITRIAYKYSKPLIPISCTATNYFELKSWDRMIVPKPFCKISVIIGHPLGLSGDVDSDNNLLETELITLSNKSQKFCREG